MPDFHHSAAPDDDLGYAPDRALHQMVHHPLPPGNTKHANEGKLPFRRPAIMPPALHGNGGEGGGDLVAVWVVLEFVFYRQLTTNEILHCKNIQRRPVCSDFDLDSAT